MQYIMLSEETIRLYMKQFPECFSRDKKSFGEYKIIKSEGYQGVTGDSNYARKIARLNRDTHEEGETKYRCEDCLNNFEWDFIIDTEDERESMFGICPNCLGENYKKKDTCWKCKKPMRGFRKFYPDNAVNRYSPKGPMAYFKVCTECLKELTDDSRN